MFENSNVKETPTAISVESSSFSQLDELSFNGKFISKAMILRCCKNKSQDFTSWIDNTPRSEMTLKEPSMRLKTNCLTKVLPALILVLSCDGLELVPEEDEEEAAELAENIGGSGDENGNFTLKMGIPSGLSLSGDGIDPMSFTIPVHRVAFFTSEFCDDENPIISELDGSRQDFMQNPVLWKGNLPEGTYKCVAIEMGTVVKVTPAETSENGICQEGKSFDLEVCQEGGTYTTIEGEDKTCLGDGNDKATLYLSTVAEAPDESIYSGDSYPFSARPLPDDLDNGASELEGALVVTGTTTGTFTVDALGSITEGHGHGEGGPDGPGPEQNLTQQNMPTAEQCQKCDPNGGEWANDPNLCPSYVNGNTCDQVMSQQNGGNSGQGQGVSQQDGGSPTECEMDEPKWGFE